MRRTRTPRIEMPSDGSDLSRNPRWRRSVLVFKISRSQARIEAARASSELASLQRRVSALLGTLGPFLGPQSAEFAEGSDDAAVAIGALDVARRRDLPCDLPHDLPARISGHASGNISAITSRRQLLEQNEALRAHNAALRDEMARMQGMPTGRSARAGPQHGAHGWCARAPTVGGATQTPGPD